MKGGLVREAERNTAHFVPFGGVRACLSAGEWPRPPSLGGAGMALLQTLEMHQGHPQSNRLGPHLGQALAILGGSPQ